jgi:hypothetical protein
VDRDGDPRRCRACDAPAGPDPLAGALERDPDGTPRWLCPDCVRRHARAIEARLPHEWW